MRESRIERAVCRWAKKHSILHLKMRPYSGGYPDDLFLFQGVCCFIEFKATDEKVEKISRQAERIKELRNLRFEVGEINDIDEGIAFLEAALLSDNRR